MPLREWIRIQYERDQVHLLYQGKLVTTMPWDKALEVAQGLHVAAKRAEEYAKRDGLIRDHGLLHRAGVRLGLIHDPVIRKEAEHFGRHDRDLRRHLPGGVQSEESVGVPAVRQHPPAKEPDNGSA